ncbi:MAG: hypothetical protein Q4A32_00945 [Lachnospiraceae bacterium]|nr:hypothetical protein [Lachnospiraceae bacterium]
MKNLQSGITVDETEKVISGTLKYVTGYTGFSGDTELQSGNFLALKVTAPEGASRTTVTLLNGSGRVVDLDEDMNVVLRIADKDTQKVKFVSYVGAQQVSTTYSLTGLTCQTE